MIETLSNLWPIVLSVVGVIAWFVRLESKLLHLSDDYHEHKENVKDRELAMWTKLDTIQTTMTSVLQGLAKIEGKLESKRE